MPKYNHPRMLAVLKCCYSLKIKHPAITRMIKPPVFEASNVFCTVKYDLNYSGIEKMAIIELNRLATDVPEMWHATSLCCLVNSVHVRTPKKVSYVLLVVTA